MDKLNLEIGKYYQNRQGTIVRILSKQASPSSSYPFLGSDREVYTSTGSYGLDEEATLDLITEVHLSMDTDRPTPTISTIGDSMVVDISEFPSVSEFIIIESPGRVSCTIVRQMTPDEYANFRK